MSRLISCAVLVVMLVTLAGCAGGSDESAAFPFQAPTVVADDSQAQQSAAAPPATPPAEDDRSLSSPTPPGDFCAAWAAMIDAGNRYASQFIAEGADELIATSDAARVLLPADAPAFTAQQIEIYAYQGDAGLLLRDMSGDTLGTFQQDLDQRYRQDRAALPANVDDFLWVSKRCPDLPEPKRYFELAADLVKSDPISIDVPPDRGTVELENHPIVFEGDPTLENEAQGGGYIGRRDHADGSSSSLTVTRQTDLHPDEWVYGECTFSGDPVKWAAQQDRVLYLEETANGTTIVITFRPQLSDLAPAVYSISLVTTEQAPTELGQAGFCQGELAVWNVGARHRYVITGEFFDGTARSSVDHGFARAFYSVDELVDAPGAAEILHAMRTMTFGFLE